MYLRTTKLLSLAKLAFCFQLLLLTPHSFGRTTFEFNFSKGDHIYTYTFSVDAQYRTKEVLTDVTNFLETSNRFMTETGFSFQSKINYTEEYLQLIFTEVGVSSFTLTKLDGKMPVVSEEKVGGTDCDFAELLCSNGSVPGNSAGFGTQELGASNRGCLAGNEHQSSWYYLNVQTGGNLTMLIDPSVNSDDYDFAIWGPFTAATAGANCPPTSGPIRCSFSALTNLTGLASMNTGTSSGCGFLGLFACPPGPVTDVTEGTGGDSYVMPLTVLANEIYILLVDNFSVSSNPYNMSFGGTAVLGCTPVVLPVEISSFTGKGINKSAFLDFTTQSELNNDYFSIEWTTNPADNNWSVIDQIYSTGDSEVEQRYSSVHTSPDLTRSNYYRLVQVDKNGARSTYSKMTLVSFDGLTKTPVKIFNLLGQEVDQDYKGIVVYVYEDGTSEKVVNP